MKNNELLEPVRSTGAFRRSFCTPPPFPGKTLCRYIDCNALFGNVKVVREIADAIAMQISDAVIERSILPPAFLATVGGRNTGFCHMIGRSLLETGAVADIGIVRINRDKEGIYVPPEVPEWMSEEPEVLIFTDLLGFGQNCRTAADAIRSMGGRASACATIFDHKGIDPSYLGLKQVLSVFGPEDLPDEIFDSPHSRTARIPMAMA